MDTGKEVNTYTSWELARQCPHSRSNHGTYNLRLLFIKREMWFIDCSFCVFSSSCAAEYTGLQALLGSHYVLAFTLNYSSWT